MSASGQMLRGALAVLNERGSLLVCERPVDPKYELGAVLCHFKNETPILFRHVKGSGIPVVGGLLGNRAHILRMLDCSQQECIPRLMSAIAHPQKAKQLPGGPVQETVLASNIDLKKLFPVPTSNGLDAKPFITSGILVYKDEETGHTHTAIRRFQVNEGGSLNVLVSPVSPHLLSILRQSNEAGKPLECAVVLGYDACFALASQLSSSKYAADKYEVDSALRGEPLELVRCHSLGLSVPAGAEIVLEGKIYPGKMGPEGPFAELMGYYSEPCTAPLLDIHCVTMRKDAIFQHTFPCREEHIVYGMIKEAEIYAMLAHTVDVKNVNLTVGGGCRLHAVVCLRKRSEGDAKSAILGTLGYYKDIKRVIVVDEDVDIFDPLDVEAAMATRFQASKDLLCVNGALGSALDPSCLEKGTCDKLGFDCTRPLHDPGGKFAKAGIPGYDPKSLDIQTYFPGVTNERRQ